MARELPVVSGGCWIAPQVLMWAQLTTIVSHAGECAQRVRPGVCLGKTCDNGVYRTRPFRHRGSESRVFIGEYGTRSRSVCALGVVRSFIRYGSNTPRYIFILYSFSQNVLLMSFWLCNLSKACTLNKEQNHLCIPILSHSNRPKCLSTANGVS